MEHYSQELPEIPRYHCIYCYLVIQPAVKIFAIVKFDSQNYFVLVGILCNILFYILC